MDCRPRTKRSGHKRAKSCSRTIVKTGEEMDPEIGKKTGKVKNKHSERVNNATSSSLSSSDYASVYSGSTNYGNEKVVEDLEIGYNKFTEISPGRHRSIKKSGQHDRKRKKHLIDDLDLNIDEIETNDFYYEQSDDRSNLRHDLIAYSVPRFFESNESDNVCHEDYLEHYKTQSSNLDIQESRSSASRSSANKYSGYSNKSTSSRSISSGYEPPRNIYDNPIAKPITTHHHYPPAHSTLSQSYTKPRATLAPTSTVPYVQHRVIVSKSNKQRGELVLEYEC
jgi:hypothetical protein